MLLYAFNFEGGKQKICRDCVDKIGGGGKSEKLNKVGEITMSKTF